MLGFKPYLAARLILVVFHLVGKSRLFTICVIFEQVGNGPLGLVKIFGLREVKARVNELE